MGAAARKLLLADLVESGVLLPVVVEGVRGLRYIVAAESGAARPGRGRDPRGLPPGGRRAGVALLAPLDPLVWDREFLRACFGFDYVWEVYVPAAKRRWGYYVLPVLYGDRLVGRIEPRIDRKAGTLRILGAWWEDWLRPARGRGVRGSARRGARGAPRVRRHGPDHLAADRAPARARGCV